MSPSLPGRARPLVRSALMTIAIGFVAYTAWTLYRRWEPDRVHVTVWLALSSMVPLVLGVVLQAWAWVRLVRRMSGTEVELRAGLKLYFDSQLARYAPGKVGLPLVRMEGGARLGLGAALVGSSILVETLSWSAVGAVASMVVLAESGSQKAAMFALLGRYAVPLSAMFALGLVLLCVVDRRRFPSFVVRLLGPDGSGPIVPPDLPAAHVVHWATWAMHGYLISYSVGAAPEDRTAAVPAFLVAPLAGFLMVAAPAGLGVREALLSLALAPSIGSSGAVATAILSRLLTLAAEVICWASMRAAKAPGPPRS